MKQNPIQFAVVREDPIIEESVITRVNGSRVLLIASGGCTALHLAATLPDVELTLVDFNPAQLDLIQRKIKALGAPASERASSFNINDASVSGLNNCGNFESLFRSLRQFIEEFIIDPTTLKRMFSASGTDYALVQEMLNHRYWPVAFDLFLHDSLLNTMFGLAATQHAPNGSYPNYFRRIFERGLMRADSHNNYFLHHVLLGYYLDRPAALPQYLTKPVNLRKPRMVPGTLTDLTDLPAYDVINLSNIFDWMDQTQVNEVVTHLAKNLKAGAVIILRQLNNTADMSATFGDGFRVDEESGATLLAKDRSMFYSRINIIQKI